MSDDIRNLLAGVFNRPPEAFNGETTMDDIEEWDSLTHLEVVAALEERFGVRFSPEEIIELTSVSRIAAIIASRAAA